MTKKQRKIVDYLPALIVTPKENKEGVSFKNNRKKSIFIYIYPLFLGIIFGIIIPIVVHFSTHGFSGDSVFLAVLYLVYVLIFLRPILLGNLIKLFHHYGIESGK